MQRIISDEPPARSEPSSSTLFSQQEVVMELKKVLTSRHFASSPRLRRFLQYVVEKASRGQDSEIKEYSIGIDVFGRPSGTYNPAIDPIVRVQARRLRAKLSEYYLDEGGTDRLVFDLPVGSYAPRFRAREQPPPEKEAREDAEIVEHSLAILPFIAISSDPQIGIFAAGLTEEVVFSLAQFPDLRIAALASMHSLDLRPRNMRGIAIRLGVAQLIEGSVRNSDAKLRVTVRLIRGNDGCHIWTGQFDHQLTDLFTTQTAVSRSICEDLRRWLSPAP